MVAAEFAARAAEKIVETGEKATELAGKGTKTTAEVLGRVTDPPGLVPSLEAGAEVLPAAVATPAASPSVREVPSHEPFDVDAIPAVNGDASNHVTQDQVADADAASADGDVSKAGQWVIDAPQASSNGAGGSGQQSQEFRPGHGTNLGNNDLTFQDKMQAGAGQGDSGDGQGAPGGGAPGGSASQEGGGEAGQGGGTGAGVTEQGPAGQGAGQNVVVHEANGKQTVAQGGTMSASTETGTGDTTVTGDVTDVTEGPADPASIPTPPSMDDVPSGSDVPVVQGPNGSTFTMTDGDIVVVNGPDGPVQLHPDGATTPVSREAAQAHDMAQQVLDSAGTASSTNMTVNGNVTTGDHTDEIISNVSGTDNTVVQRDTTGRGPAAPSGDAPGGPAGDSDPSPSGGRDTNEPKSYVEEFNGKRYEVTTRRDGTLDYTEITDQNHPVNAPADGAAPEPGSRSRADVEAELKNARDRELTYSYYRNSPAHTQAMNDVARLQAELDALGPANDTTEAPSTRDTADQGHDDSSGQVDLPEKPGRAFYQDVTGHPERQGQAEPVYANVTDAQNGSRAAASPASGETATDSSAPAARTGTPAESAPQGQGQAQYKVKEAPAAAQAQAAERPHPAEVQQQEHTTSGWSPSRVSDGLRGPTGEKIAVQGDGTQPVVLGNRGYYDNGDPLPANTLEGHRAAANATVDAVNQTAEGPRGKFTTDNTAVHGEVRVLQDTAGQAPSADIPAFRGALENIHGGQVGPTVLSNVVLNPDGSINSATMTTMHRVHGGQVRTVTSEIANGTIATPSTEGGNVNGTNPSALQYLTNDRVHSVPAGPGGPDGGSGGGPNGGGGSGSGGYDGGQRYIVLAPPGVARVIDETKRPEFTGEVHPAAARVLRRYQEQERQAAARAAGGPDEGTDGGTGGRARTRTRTQPGEPTGGETQGQTRTTGQARERILIQRPKIAEPEPTPTTRQREQANGQAGGSGQERQADGRPRTEGQPEPRADGRSKPDQKAQPRGQGQPDQNTQPDGRGKGRPEADGRAEGDGRGNGRSDGRADGGGEARGRGRSEGDGDGRPEADGKPRTKEMDRTEERAEGNKKRRRKLRKPSARQRARAKAEYEEQAKAQERQASAAPKPKPDPKETRSLYEILGIKDRKNATKADIVAAYREKARILHPDNHATGNEAEFRALNNAYDVLTDAEAKKAYDKKLAIKSVFDALKLRRRARATDMDPGEAYDLREAIAAIGGMSQEAQTAWALANILEVIRLLNGYKAIPIDGGLFGMNEEAQKRTQVLLTPAGAQGKDGIVLRVNQLDPETGARTGETEYLRITQGVGNQVLVRGSEGIADALGDPKLQDVGKDGGPATEQERIEAALKALSDALVLDYEQVKNANPVDVYEQAKETAQANGGGDDPDNKDDDGNKDDDKKDEEERKDPWAKKDEVPQKPLWQMTEAERKAYFDQQVADRMAALRREYAAKRRESGEKLRIRDNETVKEAEARRRKEDEKKMEAKRLRVELGIMNEMLDDLERERFLRLQSPGNTPIAEQRALRKTIQKMRNDVMRHQDAVIQDWRKGKNMDSSMAQSYKEFRWGAKAKGKKGNTYRRGYTDEQLAGMKGLKHPNRPGNRYDGRGPERKPNGKRKLVSKEEFKQRRREFKQHRREHDNHKSSYLSLLAEQKAIKAQLSKAKGKERGIIKAKLRAVRHNISASRRGMTESWFAMQNNSYKGMVARAAGRAVLNGLGK